MKPKHTKEVSPKRHCLKWSQTARRWPQLVLIFFASFPLLDAFLPAADTQKSASSQAAHKELHLILLAGQSNMAGRGKVAEEDRKPHPRVLTLNKQNEWVPAVEPIHFDKSQAGVGLGRTFGIEYANTHPDVTVGLVPCAAGGSPIATWEQGGYHSQTKSHPWDDTVRRMKVAMQSGTLKAILWHQGESDSKPDTAKIYERKLVSLIERMRAEFHAENVPFLIGQLGQFEGRPWKDARRQVDAAHQSVAKNVPRSAFVSAEGLIHKGDNVHFNAKSYREFGRRYFRAYQSLVTTDTHSNRAPISEKLKRLPNSKTLLEHSDGLDGDFDVASVPPKIDFCIFPGQWKGARLWSSWGDALTASDGCYYTSIGDHAAPHGTAYVYRVDPNNGMVSQVVDYNQVIGAKDETKYTPGKIHGAIVEGDEQWLYFFGYRGSVRKTSADVGYKGDWLLRYHLSSGKTENLGIPLNDRSVPVLIANRENHSLYGLAVPGQTAEQQTAQFFRYDYEANKVVFQHAFDESGPRSMLVTENGKAWFGVHDHSGNGVFAIYDGQQQVRVTNLRIPGAGMLRAATRPAKDGTVYCLSKDGVVFSVDTNKERIRQLGQAFVGDKQYIATCRLDPTERFLYYVPFAHGKSSRVGTPVIQFDFKKKRPKVLCFLAKHVSDYAKFHLGGTYGIAISDDGSQLFINWNGSQLPTSKQPDFGLCGAMIVNIPEEER